ncbi:MAG TPA: hypothetical protein PLV68_17015, partial [Ilumatobacteraceae bacterium]|nr:hypothetical protein [Ilumatobacteraceae bacterium]
ASAWVRWLDPAVTDAEALQHLLVPAPDGLLTMHPVSSEVNNARNAGSHLIEPVSPAAPNRLL